MREGDLVDAATPMPLPAGDPRARVDAAWEAERGVEFLLLDRLAPGLPQLSKDLAFYRRSLDPGGDLSAATAFVAAHNERILARLRAEGVPSWAPARRRIPGEAALAELRRASVPPHLFEPTRAERLLLRADAGRWGAGTLLRVGRHEASEVVIVAGRINPFRAAIHLLDSRERRWMCAYLLVECALPGEE